MMMGNDRMWCIFTMQQISRWVVTHSKSDSNLHGHCCAISMKQCSCGFSLCASNELSIRTLGSLRFGSMVYQ